MRGAWSLMVISLVLLVTIVVPANGRPSQPSAARAVAEVAGDIDCDGSVGIADALVAMRAFAGLPGGDCLASAGDVNCSGATNMADVLLLRRHAAQLPVDLPAGCPAIGSPIVRSDEPTSALIEAALAKGVITKGQALAFHLAAELAPQNLPAPFRGASSEPAGTALFHEVASNWPTLSSTEKDAIRPYLLPPATAGSWAEESGLAAQAVEWETVGNARIKVWWRASRPEDAAKAAAILDELDSYIWPEIVDYMGEEHAPFSDAAVPASGGDGRYDVYLVHNLPFEEGAMPVLGWVSPHLDAAGDHKCEVTPTYMSVNSRGALSPDLLSTVAHEFMHSVQFTYNVGDCNDYRWLMESTATWTESWLYPQVNSEHGYADSYLSALGVPLEHWAYAEPHQYGSYLFWYYLEKKEGLFYAVRDAWAASSNPDSLAAIDSALFAIGGLKEAWPTSARYNWNRPPFEDFSQLDSVGASAEWKDTTVQVQDTTVSYQVPTSLGHMGQDHYNFAIGDGVRTLTFLNPFYGHYDEFAKVQALVEIDGVWNPEPIDWTFEERPSFCLDRPAEKVTNLVIIITNSNFQDRTDTFDVGDGELVASPLGCKGWVGTASAEIHYFDATFTITVDNLRFEPQMDPPDTSDRYDFYDLVETGDATWHVSGVWPGGCIPSGTMTLAQPGEPNGSGGDISIDLDEGEYYIYIGGHRDLHTFTITCEDGSWQQVFPVIPIIWNGGPDNTPLKEENGTFVLDAEYTDPSPIYGGTWRWRLTELE